MNPPQPLQLSRKEARRLALQQQGLLQKTHISSGSEGVVQTLGQIGYVQIDTISVIQRAHHHTFYARNAGYQPKHLAEAMKQKSVFEYWSHAAAYLPMRDYRFSLARKYAIRRGEKHWYDKDPKLMQRVLDRIAAEGPLQSKDFKPSPEWKKSEWWEWKPSKIALEQLFMEGYLMIAERRGFQKVYDLAERVLPPDTDTREPDTREMAEHLILTGLQAHGLMSVKQIGYLRRSEVKKQIKPVLEQLERERRVIPVRIEGLEESYYTLAEIPVQIPLRLRKRQLRLLSPFDNVVIQRDRLKQLFNFDYQIECYVPKAKRQYGYFCLPILWGDRFVGRLDPKADRKRKVFLIRQLWLEPNLKKLDSFLEALAESLWEFARSNGCEKFQVEQAESPYLKSALETTLKSHSA